MDSALRGQLPLVFDDVYSTGVCISEDNSSASANSSFADSFVYSATPLMDSDRRGVSLNGSCHVTVSDEIPQALIKDSPSVQLNSDSGKSTLYDVKRNGNVISFTKEEGYDDKTGDVKLQIELDPTTESPYLLFHLWKASTVLTLFRSRETENYRERTIVIPPRFNELVSTDNFMNVQTLQLRSVCLGSRTVTPGEKAILTIVRKTAGKGHAEVRLYRGRVSGGCTGRAHLSPLKIFNSSVKIGVYPKAVDTLQETVQIEFPDFGTPAFEIVDVDIQLTDMEGFYDSEQTKVKSAQCCTTNIRGAQKDPFQILSEKLEENNRLVKEVKQEVEDGKRIQECTMKVADTILEDTTKIADKVKTIDHETAKQTQMLQYQQNCLTKIDSQTKSSSDLCEGISRKLDARQAKILFRNGNSRNIGTIIDKNIKNIKDSLIALDLLDELLQRGILTNLQKNRIKNLQKEQQSDELLDILRTKPVGVLPSIRHALKEGSHEHLVQYFE